MKIIGMILALALLVGCPGTRGSIKCSTDGTCTVEILVDGTERHSKDHK